MAFHRIDSFLFDSIHSILSPDDVRLEVILVADGQARGSIDTVRLAFAGDSRVLVLENPGVGRIAALNHGITAARFEYIGRMDSDDVSIAGRWAMQARYLSENPRVAAVGGQVLLMDADGQVYRRLRYPLRVKGRLKKPLQPPIAQPASMFRKPLWEQVGGYRELFPYVEDHDLWLRFLDLGEIHNLSSTVLKYRVHPGQISMNFNDLQLRDAALANLSNLLVETPEQINALFHGATNDDDLVRALKHLAEFDAPHRSAATRIIGDYFLRSWRTLSFRSLLLLTRRAPLQALSLAGIACWDVITLKLLGLNRQKIAD